MVIEDAMFLRLQPKILRIVNEDSLRARSLRSMAPNQTCTYIHRHANDQTVLCGSPWAEQATVEKDSVHRIHVAGRSRDHEKSTRNGR